MAHAQKNSNKQHIHDNNEHAHSNIKLAEYPNKQYIPPLKDTYVLGVESTCDETSLSLVKGGVDVIKEVTISQAKKHAEFGGVVPELAARKHLENFNIMGKAFLESVEKYPIHAVAVSYKVGLPPAVKVGESFALGVSKSLNIPLIKVNHVLAHIWGVWVDDSVAQKPDFPFLGVIISGGHTMLAIFESPTQYNVVAETLDDAIGESFDKVARVLGYGYPGGPIIEKKAKTGDEFAYDLPMPLSNKKKDYGLNFSFAGLKTAVLNLYNKLEKEHGKQLYFDYMKEDIAAGFQYTAFMHLIDRIIKAIEKYKIDRIVFGGGVSANNRLYDLLWQSLQKNKIDAYIYAPRPKYCMDNASLIAGYAINLIKK